MTTRGKSIRPWADLDSSMTDHTDLAIDEPMRTSGFYVSSRDDAKSLRVLVVDDDIELARATSRGLRRAGDEVTYVKILPSLDDAPSALRSAHFDVMLVNVDDATKPIDLVRLEHALTLAANSGETAVIATGHSADVSTAVLACSKGAQDYLHLDEHADANLLRTLRCAAERARRTYRLIADVYRDELTGLANRRLLRRCFGEAKYRAARRRERLGLLMIDLDGFKAINDALGHAAGDAVLVGVAGRLRESVRDTDLVARVGGDEFVILALAEMGVPVVDEIVQRVEGSLREPFAIEGGLLEVRASIGTATADADLGCELAAMLQSADVEMYQRKEAARRAPPP